MLFLPLIWFKIRGDGAAMSLGNISGDGFGLSTGGNRLSSCKSLRREGTI